MKEKTAEEIAGRYWREFRITKVLRFLAAMTMMLTIIWRSGADWVVVALFALYVLCILGVRRLQTSVWTRVEGTLTQDCDAVKYAEVCHLLGGRMKKSTGMIRLNEAKGLCYAGQFREAAALIDEVELSRRTGLAGKLIYQNVAFNCALRLREDLRAGEIRRETERLLREKKPGKRLRKTGETLLTIMDSGLAYQRGDWTAMRRLEEQLERDHYSHPFQRVTSAVRLAEADLAEGKPENARPRLKFAAKNGGTLWSAERARELLKEMEHCG